MSKDKVIHSFQVAWVGWESDNDVKICERKDGSRYVMMTNHDSPYEAKPEELEEILKTYAETMQDIAKGLGLIKEKA